VIGGTHADADHGALRDAHAVDLGVPHGDPRDAGERRLPAETFLGRLAHQRAVAPQGVELIGVLEQAEEETGESERLRSAREVPEDDQLEPVDLFDEFEGDPDVRDEVSGLAAVEDDPDGELLGELFGDEDDASGEEAAMHIEGDGDPLPDDLP